MLAKVLSSTEQIRNAITDLMRPGTRRVIVTAFVGSGASAYLPTPKGIELVCWPKEGGTTPNAVRDLIRGGAKLRFADRVHMKLYWASGRGAVVGSANLSTNALGAGGLKELCALLPSESIDIDQILASVNPRKVTEAELKALELRHKRLGRFAPPEPERTYLTWYDSPMRADWKLGWWDEVVGPSVETKARAKLVNSNVKDWIPSRRGDYQKDDWVLTFRLRKRTVSQISWLYVNDVVKASAKSRAEYPYEAAQFWNKRQCLVPPFALNHSFRAAFRDTCIEFGTARLMKAKAVAPTKQLLDAIATRLKLGR